jgi:hypothetical protein
MAQDLFERFFSSRFGCTCRHHRYAEIASLVVRLSAGS